MEHDKQKKESIISLLLLPTSNFWMYLYSFSNALSKEWIFQQDNWTQRTSATWIIGPIGSLTFDWSSSEEHLTSRDYAKMYFCPFFNSTPSAFVSMALFMHHSKPTFNHTDWYKKAQLHICIHSSIFFCFCCCCCFFVFFQKHSKYTKWHQLKKRKVKHGVHCRDHFHGFWHCATNQRMGSKRIIHGKNLKIHGIKLI